jgi:3-hydroxyacyl-[acyl-carrier-protein] dehydratase
MFIPGDQLHIKAEVMTVKRGIWKFKCSATVDEKIVTTAELMCTQKTAD